MAPFIRKKMQVSARISRSEAARAVVPAGLVRRTHVESRIYELASDEATFVRSENRAEHKQEFICLLPHSFINNELQSKHIKYADPTKNRA